jgi:UDP-N-acetylglucosamine:LPS N-acetylglucosamine transferase
LAVVRRLARAHPDAEVRWVGGRRGIERELVPAAGLPLARLWLRSLRTVDLSLNTLADPLRLIGSVPQALALLARTRPDVVYATGGNVTIPVLVAAAALRIPSLLWEGNRHAGRSVRATAGLATARAVTYAATGEALPEPTYVTGTPTRELASLQRADARRRLALPDGLPVVLVFGGSQYVRRLNDAVRDALADVVERCAILHITGSEGLASAEASRAALPEALRSRYRPVAFLDRDMDAALVAADLLIGRAGSSSLAEAAVLGLPMVVVPYPHAAAHQKANAAEMVRAGGAILVADEDFDGAALRRAVDLLDGPDLERMRAASRSLGRPGAAEATMRLLEALAERRALPAPAGLEAIAREAA